MSPTGPGEPLRITEVVVPPYSRGGNSITLRCQFDLEGDVLYNVKWYKGAKEFYR